MKIVIDIDDEQVLFDIKNRGLVGKSETDKVIIDALYNGTPLPKGHGRLIDADVVDNNIYDLARNMDLNYEQISEVVDKAPTIIEADKESD